MKWLVILAVVLRAGVALAGSDGIVLESYSGPRPADAAKAMEPLLRELSQNGFTTGADLGTRFEGRISRSAGSALPAGFEDQVKKARNAWVAGKFEDAVSALGPLVTAAHDNSAAFIGNAKQRDALQSALIVLALSQQRLGDPNGATATFDELIRSFPDATVAKSTWGPDAFAQFQAAQKALAGQQKGHLTVKVVDESTDVYLNERLERRGTVGRDVIAGEYRIVAQLGSQRSRSHRVTVHPNEDITISIDPTFDGAVRTAGWSGFEFATAADRERFEAPFAVQFAQAIDGKAVVVVGLDTVRSARAIVGSLVMMNGKEIRRASLALEPAPSPDRIAALAKFLTGDPGASSAGLDVSVNEASAGTSGGAGATTGPALGGGGGGGGGERHDAGRGGRWGGWPIITGVIALGALGAGGYLLAKDGKCKDGSDDPNCPDVYENKPPGIGALAGGAVFAGITVYLILTRPDKHPTKTVTLAPTDGGAMAAVWGTW